MNFENVTFSPAGVRLAKSGPRKEWCETRAVRDEIGARKAKKPVPERTGTN
jgi:hypothetical protein